MSKAPVLFVLAIMMGPLAGNGQDPPRKTPGVQAGELLSDTKDLVFALKGDMTTLDFFASERSTQLNNSVLDSYAQHISALRRHADQLATIRKDASRWQQVAMDRVIPVMKEMASSAEAAIKAAEAVRNRGSATDYQQYFKMHSDLAEELSTTIGSWVDYAKTKDDLDRMRERLGLPGPVK